MCNDEEWSFDVNIYSAGLELGFAVHLFLFSLFFLFFLSSREDGVYVLYIQFLHALYYTVLYILFI